MPTTPAQVLYIDDDPGLARLVQRALGRLGYGVVHCTSGEEGLARVDAGGIDVIALDHYLPTGTGLDVLDALRTRENAPPVVYVTGSAETSIAVAALKAGAFDYVPKTIAEEFLELLATAIDQARERAQLQRAKLQAEREVREARDRAEVLLGEVNHRVANSLALVATLVRMQAAALEDGAAKDALEETQGRISAIAGLHKRLYTSDDVRFVEIEGYLKSLVEELETMVTTAAEPSLIRVDVAPLPVPTDKAVSIGVAVTELVTNAVKYAYAGRDRGEVRVVLRREHDGTLLLAVEDNGVGWSGAGKVQGTGLGSRVVRAMAANLGTTVTYDTSQGGTRAEMRFSL